MRAFQPIMRSSRRQLRSRTGFTLVEVMVSLTLISMMCLAVFKGLGTMSQVAISTGVRSEGQRLLQAEAERLMSVSYGNFVASTADETIYSSFKSIFKSSTAAALTYPTSGNTGRFPYTRRVVAVSSTTTTRTLRVEVQWPWNGKTTKLTMLILRSQ